MTPVERLRLEQLEQGSEEWHEARRGCITASIASRILTASERSLPKLIADIRADNGRPRDLSGIPEIERGHRLEDLARLAYERREGVAVRVVGLLVHPLYPLVRCSPDGLVDPAGGVEIKCPSTRGNHLVALAGAVPAVHAAQVQFSLWTSGRPWWDLVSYRDEEPQGYQLAVVRARPDRRMFEKFERQVRLLLPYLDGGL